MKINPIIFKSYDVRGIYPSELNEESAYAVGRAIVSLTKAKKVAVGRDMRLSSLQLHKAVIDGILSQGANVYDIGEVVTELMYYSVGAKKFDAGVMVTASHNPKEYNGLKIVCRYGKTVRMIRGKDIADVVLSESFSKQSKTGVIKKLDVWQDYIKLATTISNTKKIKPFKIVIDAGNGMTGKMIPMVEKYLPVKIMPLNFKLDGNFPAHPSNFLEPGASDQVSEKIKQEKADFGFIFDGDGDRMRLIDEKGSLVGGDISLVFMAEHFLKTNPGITIPFTVPCSRAVTEWIEKLGGKPKRLAVGFVNVQTELINSNGVFGGEHPSAHYCFRDNFYCDSGLFAFLTLLQIVSESNKKVSEMVNEVYKYYRIPETNYRVENKQEIIDKVKAKYNDGKQEFYDGVTVWYKDWWLNVRPSNTEPLLRVNIEAETQKILEEKSKELSDLVKENS